MTRKIARALLALAVLVGGTAVGVSTAVGIGAQTTTVGDSRIAFGDGEMETERGGNVTVPVVLEGTDTATLKIGSDDAVNYALVVTVTDGDGDGSVAVSFDTDAAAEDDVTKVTTRSDADDATVKSEVEHFGGEPPYRPLSVGNYPVTLYDGDSEDAAFVAESRLRILESSTTATTAEATDSGTGPSTTTDVVTEPEPTGSTETAADAEGTVPGFGSALALVALAAAATLAARR